MPIISQDEALAMIQYYGGQENAAKALGVSRATLRRMAGQLPTPAKMKPESVAAVAERMSKLPKAERGKIERMTTFFSNASPNMKRAFERQKNQHLKREQMEFFDKLFKKWKKEKNAPDSTIQYHIWKAIMRKMYEGEFDFSSDD